MRRPVGRGPARLTRAVGAEGAGAIASFWHVRVRDSMKIGLISDTHIPSMGKEPPGQVIPAFEGVDLILHAGDIYIQSCIEWLERIAPVHASTSWFANMGEGAPRVSQPVVVEVEGH